jgi:hypothetical protein
MTGDSSRVTDLLTRAAQGDQEALRTLFFAYRGRLKRVAHLRLNGRLQGRVDDSAVLQARAGSRFLRALKRLREILERIPGFAVL